MIGPLHWIEWVAVLATFGACAYAMWRFWRYDDMHCAAFGCDDLKLVRRFHGYRWRCGRCGKYSFLR